MAIWNIKWRFGIFLTIWYILYSFGNFSGFGIMYQEKSGNPDLYDVLYVIWLSGNLTATYVVGH
jgi:hypothetical protein